MRVQFIGCGDAFGSGGRFNTCFHVDGVGGKFLIDCGASSLISMRSCLVVFVAIGWNSSNREAIFVQSRWDQVSTVLG